MKIVLRDWVIVMLLG